jgi:hypothetical protein
MRSFYDIIKPPIAFLAIPIILLNTKFFQILAVFLELKEKLHPIYQL